MLATASIRQSLPPKEFDTMMSSHTLRSHATRVRDPILVQTSGGQSIATGPYDAQNFVEYAFFPPEKLIEEIQTRVDTLLQPIGGIRGFRQTLADMFVEAQAAHMKSPPENNRFAWHLVVKPDPTSGIPVEPPATLDPYWTNVKTFVDMRQFYINEFLIPVLRSGCTPFCQFVNAGSGKLTSDIDITVTNARGGIIKHLAQYITDQVFATPTSVYTVGASNVQVEFTTDLSDLMDTNVYPTNFYDFCNISVDQDAPRLLSIDNCNIFQTFRDPTFTPFAGCQIAWSLVRVAYAFLRKDEGEDFTRAEHNLLRHVTHQQDIFRDATKRAAIQTMIPRFGEDTHLTLKQIEEINKLPAVATSGPLLQVEDDAKAVREFIKIIKNGAGPVWISALRRADAFLRVEEQARDLRHRVLNFCILAVERCLRAFQIRMSNLWSIYKSTIGTQLPGETETAFKTRTAALRAQRDQDIVKLQTEYRYEYYSLQSMLYMFEEEAYYSVGAFLHVVMQMQMGIGATATTIPAHMYIMSYFDNLGFYIQSRKEKYITRMEDALLRMGIASPTRIDSRAAIDEATVAVLNKLKEYYAANTPFLDCYHPPASDERVLGDQVEVVGGRRGILVNTSPVTVRYFVRVAGQPDVEDVSGRTLKVLNGNESGLPDKYSFTFT